MKLYFKKAGSGAPLLILHGVFGSSDNWFTVGKELARDHEVYFVDLRNHGQSPHDPEFNYQVMAADILELIEDQGLREVNIIGHSMGGKVAMELATSNSNLVRKLVVVDIGPKMYPSHHKNIYEGFRSLKLSELKTRNEADEKLAEKIPDFGVRQFILKNLMRSSSGGFEWKLNLDAIEKNAENIGKALSENATFEKPALFIGGRKSDYILPGDVDAIAKHFPNSRVEWIEGSGHWVHAEKPSELISSVSNFLKN